MSFLGRIFLLLLALGLLAVSVLTTSSVMGWIPETHLAFAGFDVTLAQRSMTGTTVVLWWVVSVPLLLASALLVLIAFTGDKNSWVVLHRREEGHLIGGDELVVSRRGLDALVVYEAQKVKGVLQAQSRVRLKKKGWRIEVDLALVPGAAIPEVAPQVHESVGESMLHHTGIAVDKVRLRVSFGSGGKKKRVA